jgi:hypothetical protein
MKDDNEELMVLLCTRIGTIMDDASVLALTIRATRGGRRTATIAELQRAAESIAAFVTAAEALG